MKDPDIPEPSSFPWLEVAVGGFVSFLVLLVLQSFIGFSNLVIFMFVVVGGFCFFIIIFLVSVSRSLHELLHELEKKIK